jgi:hypothetical protein
VERNLRRIANNGMERIAVYISTYIFELSRNNLHSCKFSFVVTLLKCQDAGTGFVFPKFPLFIKMQYHSGRPIGSIERVV